ncbi:MAG: MoxR family ATPase [bacterium]
MENKPLTQEISNTNISYKPSSTDWDSIFRITELINKSIHFIDKNLVGRKEVIKQSFYAILTGEHQLLIGRTGMAKSLLARQILGCFDKVSVFEKQLTKDTMPDNLFGMYDMETMKKGKLFHNVEGSIVLADFAFIDEIFDANDMLLRSLLSLLNEKRLVNGEQIVESSLNTVISAANYIRVTDVLEAVIDRFLYKSYIPEDKSLYYQVNIDMIYKNNVGNIAIPYSKIKLHELVELKKLIKGKDIEIPDFILFIKNYILKQYIHRNRRSRQENSTFTISDRTSAKTQNLLKASALLAGRKEVSIDDLDNLHYLICTIGKEDEIKELKMIVDEAKQRFKHDLKVLNILGYLLRSFNEFQDEEKRKLIIEDTEWKKNLLTIRNDLGESPTFMEKVKDMVNMIIHPRATEIAEIIILFKEMCELLKKEVHHSEILSFIVDFEKDINQVYLKNIGASNNLTN